MAGDMNVRTTQELNGLLISMNIQVQRAIDNAINIQIIPHFHYTIRASTGDKLCERPDASAEGLNRALNETN